MTTAEAAAEVFWTAFKMLRKAEREAVIQRRLSDSQTREDLIDIVTSLQREHERRLPYERVRADLKKASRRIVALPAKANSYHLTPSPPSLGGYVTVTGATGGATAAGGRSC